MKQDNLNSFLAVAERLRVRGLCQNDGSSNSSNSKSSRQPQPEKPKPSRLSETYGEKPIIFSFEENGEQYMIGSEVSPVEII